jgi:hypothetical protein
MNPSTEAARFVFTPPKDAKKLETLSLDAIGEIALGEE